MDAVGYRTLIGQLDDELSLIYKRRRRLQRRFAEHHPLILPAVKVRTPTQQLVARCPRCGTRLED